MRDQVNLINMDIDLIPSYTGEGIALKDGSEIEIKTLKIDIELQNLVLEFCVAAKQVYPGTASTVVI
jgi:hypothetical protein